MKKTLFLLLTPLLTQAALASQVEVLHWWTSGGEARAINELKALWQAEGNQWQDFAIQGGGGKSAMTVLKSRALAANPPQAAHLKGAELHEWSDLGFLRDLGPMASHFGWYQEMPTVVRQTLSPGGSLVAVPTGIHRVNWLWINRRLLREHHLAAPTDWEGFIHVAEQLQKRGVTALAIGNDPWQLTVLFEAVALGEGGAHFYRKAFLELDPATLTGPAMVRVLNRFHQLRPFVPESFVSLKWNQATNLLESGGAAMQVMGDWVKGELSAGHYRPGEDILCQPTPGSQGIFSYNIDSIAMFKVRDPVQMQAQSELANLIMRPDTQIRFNLAKGSIPALIKSDMAAFDPCAQLSRQAFAQAEQAGTLLPSMAEGMVLPTALQQTLMEVLVAFFNDPASDATSTAQRIGRLVNSAR